MKNPFERKPQPTSSAKSTARRFREYLQHLGRGDEAGAAGVVAEVEKQIYLYPAPEFKLMQDAARLLADLVLFEVLASAAAGWRSGDQGLVQTAAAHWAGFKRFCEKNKFDFQGFRGMSVWRSAPPESWEDSTVWQIIEALEELPVAEAEVVEHAGIIFGAWAERDRLAIPEVKF